MAEQNQYPLYPLDQKDIESVAKGRVNRAEGNKPVYYIALALAFVMAGIVIAQNLVESQWIGWVVAIVGVLFFVYYMNRLSKKQNYYKAMLVNEWRQEEVKKEKK